MRTLCIYLFKQIYLKFEYIHYLGFCLGGAYPRCKFLEHSGNNIYSCPISQQSNHQALTNTLHNGVAKRLSFLFYFLFNFHQHAQCAYPKH